MTICKNCKQELPDNANFCIYCGEKVENVNQKDIDKINSGIEDLVHTQYQNYKKFINSNHC